MNNLNVCFIGVGGVGGYFGGKLAHTFSSNPDPPVTIFFVARGKHLEAIKRNGLVVKSPEFGSMTCRPTLAAERISELPPIDIFLIAVKGYDLMDAAASIRNHVEQNTVILPLLNGADIQERLRDEIETGMILPACVYISAHIEEPGVVVHIGKPGKTIPITPLMRYSGSLKSLPLILNGRMMQNRQSGRSIFLLQALV
jgi:2-dehydropantoate 2-reductase